MRKIIAVITAILMLVGVANAAVIFNNIPAILPGSFPSVGFEATSTAQLGADATFAGTERQLTKVTVTLTDWACQNDFTYSGGVWTANRAGTAACVTTPGATFSHPITLNIYAVSGSPHAAGALLATKTQAFDIPFRPSYDATNCAANDPTTDAPFGGKWYDPVQNACVHGYNSNIVFDFTSDNVVLPDEVIYAVAYDTSNYGANPIGSVGPYDSLNYGLPSSTLVGTYTEAGAVFMQSSWGGAYCDNGVSGTGTFRRDAGCWDAYEPAAKIEATSNVQVPEFGILAGAVALVGLVAGVVIMRKRQ